MHLDSLAIVLLGLLCTASASPLFNGNGVFSMQRQPSAPGINRKQTAPDVMQCPIAYAWHSHGNLIRGETSGSVYLVNGLFYNEKAVIKRSFVRREEAIKNEINNLKLVDLYRGHAYNETNMCNGCFVYDIVMKYTGGNPQDTGLQDDELRKLANDAVKRIREDYGMIRTKGDDNLQKYSFLEEKPGMYKAYMVDWVDGKRDTSVVTPLRAVDINRAFHVENGCSRARL